jgi:hypothetical protein
MHLIQIGTRIINIEHVSKATFNPNGDHLVLQLGSNPAEFKGEEAIRLWEILKKASSEVESAKK